MSPGISDEVALDREVICTEITFHTQRRCYRSDVRFAGKYAADIAIDKRPDVLSSDVTRSHPKVYGRSRKGACSVNDQVRLSLFHPDVSQRCALCYQIQSHTADGLLNRPLLIGVVLKCEFSIESWFRNLPCDGTHERSASVSVRVYKRNVGEIGGAEIDLQVRHRFMDDAVGFDSGR